MLGDTHSVENGSRLMSGIHSGSFSYQSLGNPTNPLHKAQVEFLQRILEGIKILTALLYEGLVKQSLLHDNPHHPHKQSDVTPGAVLQPKVCKVAGGNFP